MSIPLVRLYSNIMLWAGHTFCMESFTALPLHKTKGTKNKILSQEKKTIVQKIWNKHKESLKLCTPLNSSHMLQHVPDTYEHEPTINWFLKYFSC
jgi:hypothetical protein